MMRKLVMTAALALAVAAAGCAADGAGQPGPGGSVPPTGVPGPVPPTGATEGPPPLPDVSPPATPSPALGTPVPGSRDRTARWTLAGQAEGGRVLLLDVTAGGPQCDAVTGIDVVENPRSVKITVYAGATGSAPCPGGVPAVVGTIRVPVRLAAPVGGRAVLGGG
ncbi:MAG TPA: hypothetical protein VFR67_18490 [Pilimelia sp.]|nr:hypothetical protein [Pilimelia sp.]